MMQLYVLLKGNKGEIGAVVNEVRVSLLNVRYVLEGDRSDTEAIPLSDIAYMEVKDV